MDCREAESKLSWVLDGEAPEAAAHVAECAACREKLEALREADRVLVRAALRMLPGPAPRRARRTGWGPWALLSSAAAVLAGFAGWLAWDWAFDPAVPMVTVIGPEEWVEDAETLLRVAVRDSRDGTAMPGTPVSVSLEDGATVTGATDAEGIASVRVPAPAGDAAMVLVSVVTPIGSAETRARVRLRRPVRVLLSTDKPLYQPGQTVRIRALAMDDLKRRPFEGELSLEVHDGNGTRVLRRTLRTSAFGIASDDLPLAEEVLSGRWRVKASAGGATSERTFDVKRYVLPKFRVDVETDRTFYAPGERALVAVDASYFFGKPCAGARVTAELGEWVADEFRIVATSATVADERGHARTDLTIPALVHGTELAGGDALLRLEVGVRDGAGHVERKAVILPVSAAGIHIAAIPEGGAVITGLAAQRLYVVASWPDGRPAGVSIRVAGGDELSADAFGVVTVPVPGQAFEVEARDASGRRVTRRIDLRTEQHVADGFVLRADRTEARGGDTVRVSLMALYDAVFYLDLVRGPETLLTTTLRTRDGRGEIAIDLPADAKGSYTLSAWKVRPDGSVERRTLPVFVRSADGLRVTPILPREEWKPGEEIVAELQVTDRDGRPVPSALGVSVVDEAVWALSTSRPGMEQTFFDIQESLLQPRFQVQAVGLPAASPARVAMAVSPPPPVLVRDDSESRLRRLFHAHATASGRFAALLAWATGAVAACGIAWACSARWPFVAPFLGMAGGALLVLLLIPSQSDSALLPVLLIVVGATASAGGWAWLLPLPGRLRVVAAAGGAIATLLVTLVIAGAFVATQHLGRAYRGAVAADAARAVPAKEKVEAAAAGPRVREVFPETLYWNPEIVTDDQGRATLRFPGADSVTTWRLGLNAVSQDGRLGAADAPVRVFQPFFVDLDLPVALTQGDELWIPVAVYNYLPEAQSITLTFEAESGFDVLDGASRTVEVGPGDVTAAHVHVRARQHGRHRLRVTAVGPRFSDAVRRTLDVLPDGRRLTAAAGGLLSGSARGTLTIPGSAVDGASTLHVRLFPSRIADLVTGLDSLARMPYG